MEAMNTASEVTSASQRPAWMRLSPNNSTSRPPAMGSQVRSERIGNPCMFVLLLSVSRVRNQPSITARPMTIQNA